jgi:hypothetical protein
MSKRLTLKQLKFIQIYIETGNATKAAMTVYNCKNENTAKSLGSENLTKPDIACEIEKYRKEGGLSIQKAINAINDGYGAEKKGDPDHAIRLRSADMTLKLADAYPRNKEVSHRHAHLHLEMVKELAKNCSFDELTGMQKEEMRKIPAEEIAASPFLQQMQQTLFPDELSEFSTEGNIAKG